MNTATRVRTIAWETDSALYRLEPPLTAGGDTYEHVVISAVPPINGDHGAIALAATHEGEVTSWNPIAQSESAEHTDLLRQLGYEVAP